MTAPLPDRLPTARPCAYCGRRVEWRAAYYSSAVATFCTHACWAASATAAIETPATARALRARR